MTGKSSEKLLFLGLKFDLKRPPWSLKGPLKNFLRGPGPPPPPEHKRCVEAWVFQTYLRNQRLVRSCFRDSIPIFSPHPR